LLYPPSFITHPMCPFGAWDFFILSFFIDIFPNFALNNPSLSHNYESEPKKDK